MIVEEASPDVSSVDWSFESTASNAYTPSHFGSPFNDPSLAPCGSLQFFKSFSLSPLFQHSPCDSDPEVHSNDALRNSVRPLDEGEDLTVTFPPGWIAAFRNSSICLGQGKAAEPSREDDEALVRMSIRSLDVGEEPVFDLPSGWEEAFVSPPDVTVPSSSQSQTTRKISVLPRLKSLWKRATSKFGSRQV